MKRKNSTVRKRKIAVRSKSKAKPKTTKKAAQPNRKKAAIKVAPRSTKRNVARKTAAASPKSIAVSKAPSQETARAEAPQRRRYAPTSMHDILYPSAEDSDLDFRDAPTGWTKAKAEELAINANLKLMEDHWEVMRVLQGCYRDEAAPRLRLLRDALQARFAAKGGVKYLYRILPGGPIVQGCALAGLKPPAGARDLSFGSVA
jgi:tRNA 2-thiouridine synthesizing protein E